jgi:hypothetical protein
MIRPSDLFAHDDPSTPSRVQESVPARLEDKFSVGLTCQASSSEVACNVETDVRRGRSDDTEDPISVTDRGRGESCRSGSRVVEQMGKTEYVNEYLYVG